MDCSHHSASADHRRSQWVTSVNSPQTLGSSLPTVWLGVAENKLFMILVLRESGISFLEIQWISSTSFLVFHSIYVHIGLLKKFVELGIGDFWIWEFYLNLVLKYPNISMKYFLHSIFFSVLLGLLSGKIWTAGPIFHVLLGFCAKLWGELSSSKFQLTNAVFSWVLSPAYSPTLRYLRVTVFHLLELFLQLPVFVS